MEYNTKLFCLPLFLIFLVICDIILVNCEVIPLSECCDPQESGKCAQLTEKSNFSLPLNVLDISNNSSLFRFSNSSAKCMDSESESNFTLSFNFSQEQGNKRGIRFTKDGKLIHARNTYDPDEYCFTRVGESDASILVCSQECSKERPCISRCCDYGQAWLINNSSFSCKTHSGENRWTPTFYSTLKGSKDKINIRPIYIKNHPREICKENPSPNILTLSTSLPKKAAITFHKPFLKPGKKSLKRLWAYIAVGFIVPGIVVGTGIALDLIYKDDKWSDTIIPDYGKVRCYIEPDLAPLPFLYGPTAVLLGINIILFALTIFSLYKAKRATDFATSSSTKHEKSKQSTVLFGKLFFVMGIPWIGEVISWALVGNVTDFPWYVVFLDMLTISQSILVFAIFVLKKETINSLESKYPRFKALNQLMTKIRRDPEYRKFFRCCGLQIYNDDRRKSQLSTKISEIQSGSADQPHEGGSENIQMQTK